MLSDLHCGHNSGLTHPDFQHDESQKKIYDLFLAKINDIKPIDICLVNGDAIEGKNSRNGGTEVWTADRKIQVDCAEAILKDVGARDYILTYGTQYHVSSDGEDWESILAHRVKGRIDDIAFMNINGVTIQAKHHIGGSTIPHGRFTPLARQKVWNILWSEFDETPRVNIIIRSHVHHFDYCGGYNWYAVITPALQAWGSKYGARRCEQTIDFGFLWWDIGSISDIQPTGAWIGHDQRVKIHNF